LSELKRTELTVHQERAILVGVILPGSTADPRDPLGELGSLIKTAGAREVGRILQRRQKPDSGTYIGTGKAAEIARLAKQQKANVVVFDNDLSPGQIGALEKIINEEAGSKRTEGIKVLDRSELILDIFATRARTHEARLQVELAQMQYTYPRLARMWGHLERIAGQGGGMGIGTRGPGETQLETDRRIVRKRIADLRSDIDQIQQRKSRLVAQRNREHFTVCIVGYTNAGKSTLFNTLTSAGAYADDKLFATLDTKTRAWNLERGAEVLLSDTVGFVRDLPHNLVASFKATLEEAIHADLLLHVLDVGHPHAQQQFDSVHQVLKEIGIQTTNRQLPSSNLKPQTSNLQPQTSNFKPPSSNLQPQPPSDDPWAETDALKTESTPKPEILLLNKIDTEEGETNFPVWRTLHPDAIPISAATGAGLQQLQQAVYNALRGQQVDVTLSTEVTRGKLLAFIESHTRVQDRQFIDGRVILQTRMGKQTLADLARNDQVEIQKITPASPTIPE
jgi:GTP-binding protein HflX